MVSVKKRLAMNPVNGTIIVPSKSRHGVNHEVNRAGLTCTCEHSTKSRLHDRDRCDHRAAAITMDGFIPLPSGRWLEPPADVLALLENLAEEQYLAKGRL